MVDRLEFLEWARVHDNFYGISLQAWRDTQKLGKICIMEVDVQGARTIKSIAGQYDLQPKYLFIAPPAVEKLEERLWDRFVFFVSRHLGLVICELHLCIGTHPTCLYLLHARYCMCTYPSIPHTSANRIVRGTESPEQIRLRLENARKEIQESSEPGLFDHILLNNEYKDAVNEFFRKMRDW
jgi:guanylate kinase